MNLLNAKSAEKNLYKGHQMELERIEDFAIVLVQ